MPDPVTADIMGTSSFGDMDYADVDMRETPTTNRSGTLGPSPSTGHFDELDIAADPARRNQHRRSEVSESPSTSFGSTLCRICLQHASSNTTCPSSFSIDKNLIHPPYADGKSRQFPAFLSVASAWQTL
jgi:hypothetical protein